MDLKFYESKLFRFLFDTEFGLKLIRKTVYIPQYYHDIYWFVNPSRFWNSRIVLRVVGFLFTLVIAGICFYLMWFETSMIVIIIKVSYILYIIWFVFKSIYDFVWYGIYWLLHKYICLINGLIAIESKTTHISRVLDDGSFIDDNGNHIKPIIPISDVYNAISYYNCKNVTYFEFPEKVRNAMRNDTYKYLIDTFNFGISPIIHYDL